MTNGAITLGDIADLTDKLRVACTRCDRVGEYRIDRLMAKHGSWFTIPGLLSLLARDCPKQENSVGFYDIRGIHCPELPGLFGVGLKSD